MCARPKLAAAGASSEIGRGRRAWRGEPGLWCTRARCREAVDVDTRMRAHLRAGDRTDTVQAVQTPCPPYGVKDPAPNAGIRQTSRVSVLATPPVASRRRYEVEALRGVAALAVLVSHCWGIGHGYSPDVFGTVIGRLGLAGGQGLALFFALSGYLLTRPLLAGRAGGRIELRRYFRHRAARILPTWWFVVAFMLWLHPDQVPERDWWRFPLLIQGFWPGTTIRVDGPAWSLAVEAQFYLLLPVLGLVLRRYQHLALSVVAGLAVVSTTLTLATITYGAPGLVWQYSLPANLVYFTPGMLLAVLEVETTLVSALRRCRHVRSGLLLLSLPGWLAYVVEPRFALLSAVASGLTVAAVGLPLGEDSVVRVLRHRALVVLGTLSFGVYLWHEPVVRLLREHGTQGSLALLMATLPITALLATGSYLLVERPCLRLRDASRQDLCRSLRQGNDARNAVMGAAVMLAVGLLALVT
ncbi:MAG: acyltransferase family protein [Mycobacteriales bacterium]